MTYFQAEANKLQETIDRVRELAESFADYNWAKWEMEYTYSGKVVCDLIIRVLDGEPDV